MHGQAQHGVTFAGRRNIPFRGVQPPKGRQNQVRPWLFPVLPFWHYLKEPVLPVCQQALGMPTLC